MPETEPGDVKVKRGSQPILCVAIPVH